MFPINNLFQFNGCSAFTDILQLVVDVIGIIVTACVSIWIVRTIQNKINNERSLKDYLISEISVIQNEYRVIMANVQSGKESPKLLRIKFHNLNSKVNQLMRILNQKFGIPLNLLSPYQTTLPMIIEDDSNFQSVYRIDSRFTISKETAAELYKLDNDNGHLFYELIIRINDNL